MNKSIKIGVSIIFLIIITVASLILLNIRREKDMLGISQDTQITETQQGMVSREEFQAMNNEVSKYIVLSQDGTIGLSKDVPADLYDKYNLEYLEKRFEELNQQVRDGKIKINKDLSIVKIGE